MDGMVCNRVKVRARLEIMAGGAFQFLGILMLFGTIGLSPARAQAPQEDTNPLNSVLGFVGMQFDKDKESIDYRARPPIVVPPHLDLPKPKEIVHDASWPNDPDAAERRHAAAARLTPAPQLTPQARAELTPAEMQSASRTDLPAEGPADNCQAGAGTPICIYAPWKMLQNAVGKIGGSKSDTVFLPGVEPSRAYLTEPPGGYRKPTGAATATMDPPKEQPDAADTGAYVRSQQHKASADN
jgi:hypothetical protein